MERKPSIDGQNAEQNENPSSKELFPMHVRHVPLPNFKHRLRSFWRQFFGTIALMEFVLKNPCQQLCSFSLAACQRSYACPIAQRLQTTWKVLGAQFFGTIALMKFVLKTCANSSASQCVASSQRSSPQVISHGFPSNHPVVASISLPPIGTLPNLFPTVSPLSVGNRLGRAPWGRIVEMEATTRWTEGKPWEIAWGELRWEGAGWKRRQGEGGRGKTVGNSLGRAPGWTEGKPREIAWGEVSGKGAR